MNNLIISVLLGLAAPGLAGRVARNAPNCKTIYETKWKTVYHEYEVSVCTNKTEQVCHSYTYNQCTKVPGMSCITTNETTCNITHTVEKEKYTESNCSTTCVPHCEYHWDEDDHGNKVWVEDKDTCKYEEEENCLDVEKWKSWKNYTSTPINTPAQVCFPSPDVECTPVEDQFCTEVKVCYCTVEHKKVPIKFSIKQPKIVCEEAEETYGNTDTTPKYAVNL